MRATDLIGHRFGSFVVISRAENTSDRHAQWQCRCDCGRELKITGKALRAGINPCACRKDYFINELGNKYGRLTVIDEGPIEKYGAKTWLCKCDCGGTLFVKGANLRNGGTTSCGCLKSHGEEKIAEMLQDLGISFVRNYKVVYQDNIYFFDFLVDNKYFIEFDGEQHFSYRETGWNDYANFINNRRRDNQKNNYCFLNKIPLIRIPYDKEYDSKDLVLRTSRFILTQNNILEYYNAERENNI